MKVDLIDTKPSTDQTTPDQKSPHDPLQTNGSTQGELALEQSHARNPMFQSHIPHHVDLKAYDADQYRIPRSQEHHDTQRN